jgi:hypothetical protein
MRSSALLPLVLALAACGGFTDTVDPVPGATSPAATAAAEPTAAATVADESAGDGAPVPRRCLDVATVAAITGIEVTQGGEKGGAGRFAEYDANDRDAQLLVGLDGEGLDLQTRPAVSANVLVELARAILAQDS